ncbi:MAG: TetR/AcrR family transcriptional regulator [Promethearchaeota archaeon]|nr:MAG: TetR/AcrR family transcriptional regulator [Candidatus Lokiarchaeota archaeon]
MMEKKSCKKILTRAINPIMKYMDNKTFKRILEAGKEIILEKGQTGLNMRSLGKRLNMEAGNIYRYVDNKRDLWIAIKYSFYDDFIVQFNKIIDKHEGSYLELFIKFAELYLEFASENFYRFEMVFLSNPPESSKIGKIEREMDSYAITRILFELIKQAVDAKELRKSNALKTYYTILSLLVGAAKNEDSLKQHMVITKPLSVKSEISSITEYRNFILKNVRDIYKKNAY